MERTFPNQRHHLFPVTHLVLFVPTYKQYHSFAIPSRR